MKSPMQDVGRILLHLRVAEQKPVLGMNMQRRYLTHLPASSRDFVI
jgi:hypothetical protein